METNKNRFKAKLAPRASIRETDQHSQAYNKSHVSNGINRIDKRKNI